MTESGAGVHGEGGLDKKLNVWDVVERDPYGLVVRFLAYTGLWWGEMAALRVRDIDPLRRRMLIARSVTEDNGRLVWDTTVVCIPVPMGLV